MLCKNKEKQGKNKKRKIFSSECFANSKRLSTFAIAFRKTKANLCIGVVVQLVRIPACHAGGRGFESRPYRQKSAKADKQRMVRSYIG